jgi:2-polyprenyl-6-methoxyphenol hydroxylase-like FAD-dependent oxidoreductase
MEECSSQVTLLPPSRGGYGANTGIDDAHNLAWKLAAVLLGKYNPDLLDTYDAERRSRTFRTNYGLPRLVRHL